jgi:tRNA(adenine34) deaminase
VKLFTNLEPCLMCLGAAMSFFLGEIYYALESPGDGAVNMALNWQRDEGVLPGYQVPTIQGGLLRDESQALFRLYLERYPTKDSVYGWVKTLTEL